jgi:hypothetical protein
MEGLGDEIDVERRIGDAVAMLDQPVGRHRIGFGQLPVLAGELFGLRGCLGRPLVARRLEQRILLQLLGDEAFDFEVGKRQQLDRLLQLRRHHQRLALAQVEARCQRHRYSSKPSPR